QLARRGQRQADRGAARQPLRRRERRRPVRLGLPAARRRGLGGAVRGSLSRAARTARARFSDLLSLACTAARRLGAAETYARALFRAVFVDDLIAVDRAMCVARAGAVGLDPTAFSHALDDPQTQAERERVLHQAMRLGVFGVPSFVVGERLFWGNDRLVLLRHALLSPPHRPGAAATTL
ncbi:MAG: DsbA family protein, partial [Acetobacteraceae bacterium]|nr:DsbA family protein [Acetobacteraceae bacterium]